jgi:membrane associated rhomboid family serine protease
MLPLADDTHRRTIPVVTITLIVINFLVFFYELALGPNLDQFIGNAGLVPARIFGPTNGLTEATAVTYLSPFISMFLHAGWLHIIFNMLFLWVFGDNVEDATGHLKFLVFYLLCGLVADTTWILFNLGSDVPSIGASGAIAGVLGAYFVLYPRGQVRTLLFLGPFITLTRIPALLVLGFWFVEQLFNGVASLTPLTAQTSGVAVWAHVGGFIAGVLLILLFRTSAYTKRSLRSLY